MRKTKVYNVIGTIKDVKGTCHVGHKVGDQLNLSGHSSDGLCGFLYHDIFPFITMLQFGGEFPAGWRGSDKLRFSCMDKANCVTVELSRKKK